MLVIFDTVCSEQHECQESHEIDYTMFTMELFHPVVTLADMFC